MPPAVEEWTLNHRTTREVPRVFALNHRVSQMPFLSLEGCTLFPPKIPLEPLELSHSLRLGFAVVGARSVGGTVLDWRAEHWCPVLLCLWVA